MAYVTSFEEIGLKIGMEKGEKIGLEKGEKIGLKRGEKIGLKRGEKRGLKRGEKIGFKIGIAKGRKMQAFKTAKKMLKDNLPIDTIIRLTGLSKEEVQPLLQKSTGNSDK